MCTFLAIFSTALVFICLWLYLSRPEIGRKHVVSNLIQALVEGQRVLNDSDKIVLIAKQLENIDFENVPKWQKDAFKEKVLRVVK